MRTHTLTNTALAGAKLPHTNTAQISLPQSCRYWIFSEGIFIFKSPGVILAASDHGHPSACYRPGSFMLDSPTPRTLYIVSLLCYAMNPRNSPSVMWAHPPPRGLLRRWEMVTLELPASPYFMGLSQILQLSFTLKNNNVVSYSERVWASHIPSDWTRQHQVRLCRCLKKTAWRLTRPQTCRAPTGWIRAMLSDHCSHNGLIIIVVLVWLVRAEAASLHMIRLNWLAS